MIPAAAVEAAARAYYPSFWSVTRDISKWDTEHEDIKERCREKVRPILEAAAPHILNDAAHDLAGADKTSRWDDMYQKLKEQDGGDLSSESTAYLNGIADAMRFLQARAQS